jgi:CheY-like chemotaxis protein
MESIEILLVEDDPNDVELTLHTLRAEKLGNKIALARDGAEALELLFGEERRRPKLILLDLKLPKVDGLEVLHKIKQSSETRAIPVVILTSSREDRDRVESYQLGVNSYIQKPVDFDEFRRTIKTLGMYWLVVNQPPPDSAFREK